MEQKVANKDVTRMRKKEASVNQSMFVLPSGVCLQLFSPRYVLCSVVFYFFALFLFIRLVFNQSEEFQIVWYPIVSSITQWDWDGLTLPLSAQDCGCDHRVAWVCSSG